MQAYVGWLKTYSKKYKVSVHAWVLMTNHVHILCTPSSNDGISKSRGQVLNFAQNSRPDPQVSLR
jgi:REP element-mobilizing transposase RayT